MAIRLDLSDFIANFSQIGAASIAGQIAGQQQREAREMQEFQVMQSALSQEASRQDAQDRFLGGLRLTPESQATLAGGIAGRPNPMAPLAGTPYAQRNPALQQILTRGGAATTRPGITPVGQPPASGRTFPSRYGPLELTGVDPKEATRVMGEIDKSLAGMQKLIVSTPEQAKLRDELFRQRAALGPLDTPEKLQAANTLLMSAQNFASQVGGPAAEGALRSDVTNFEQEFEKGNKELGPLAFASTLPGWLQREKDIRARFGKRGYGGKGLETAFGADIEEIQRRLDAKDTQGATERGEFIRQALNARRDPGQASKELGAFYKALSLIAPTQRTPEVVRKLAANAKVDWMLEGLPDESLLLGGAAAEKAMQDFLKRMSTQNFAGLSKEAQTGMIQEALTLGEYLGRKLPLPAEFVGKLTPWQKAQLANQHARIGISGDLRDIAQANLELSRSRLQLDREKARLDRLQKTGQLSDLQRKEIEARRQAVEDARKQLDANMERLTVLPGNVDLDNPKTDDERLYAELIQKMRDTEDDYVTYMRGLGIQVDPVTDIKYRPAPDTRPTAEPARKTILGIPYGPAVQPPGTRPPSSAPATPAPAPAPSTGVAAPVKGRPTPDQVLSTFPAEMRTRIQALPKNAAGFPILPNQSRAQLVEILMQRKKSRQEAERIAGLFGPSTR